MQSMMRMRSSWLVLATPLLLTVQLRPTEGVARYPTKSEKFQVVKYGPADCVSTYPSEKGTCILKTDCAEKALEGVSMGLVCADAKGETVRHIFGADSFEHKETFDTLIPCTQCLALDNFDSGKDTEEAVLKDEVNTLKSDFDALNARVTTLEKASGKAEAPPGDTAEGFLIAHRHVQPQEQYKRKHGVHKKKKHHRQHQKEEEDEEQEEDDKIDPDDI